MRAKSVSCLRTLDLAYIALFAAWITACAWVSIPVPKPFVPFTMQTFAIFSSLMILGGRRGLYTVVVYLLLGAVGLPVFTGFHGGPAVLLGTTGGYLLGFVALALAYWFLTAKWGNALRIRIAGCVLGLALCYAFGTAWFVLVYAASGGSVGVMAALGLCVFPFLIPDAVKLVMAVALAKRMEAAIK